MARMLGLLQGLAPSLLTELAECISGGLLQLLLTGASKLSQPAFSETWGLILQLIAEFALHPTASASSWESLSLIVNDGISHVTRDNYSACLYATAAFASDLNQRSQSRSLAALERILMLYRHFPSMVLAHQQAAEYGSNGDESDWEEAFAVLWLDTTHQVCHFVMDPRPAMRHEAVSVLHQMLFMDEVRHTHCCALILHSF